MEINKDIAKTRENKYHCASGAFATMTQRQGLRVIKSMIDIKIRRFLSSNMDSDMPKDSIDDIYGYLYIYETYLTETYRKKVYPFNINKKLNKATNLAIKVNCAAMSVFKDKANVKKALKRLNKLIKCFKKLLVNSGRVCTDKIIEELISINRNIGDGIRDIQEDNEGNITKKVMIEK